MNKERGKWEVENGATEEDGGDQVGCGEAGGASVKGREKDVLSNGVVVTR